MNPDSISINLRSNLCTCNKTHQAVSNIFKIIIAKHEHTLQE